MMWRIGSQWKPEALSSWLDYLGQFPLVLITLRLLLMKAYCGMFVVSQGFGPLLIKNTAP